MIRERSTFFTSFTSLKNCSILCSQDDLIDGGLRLAHTAHNNGPACLAHDHAHVRSASISKKTSPHLLHRLDAQMGLKTTVDHGLSGFTSEIQWLIIVYHHFLTQVAILGAYPIFRHKGYEAICIRRIKSALFKTSEIAATVYPNNGYLVRKMMINYWILGYSIFRQTR